MQADMLYLTMSATLCALRIVTTVMFGAGAAIAGAIAAPTVRFVLMDVTSDSPSCKSPICTSAAHHIVSQSEALNHLIYFCRLCRAQHHRWEADIIIPAKVLAFQT